MGTQRDFEQFVEDSTDRVDRIRCGVRASHLYSAFLHWLTTRGKQTVSPQEFAKIYVAAGFCRKTSNGVWVMGLRLKPDTFANPFARKKTESSDAARFARRQVRLALEDHYDHERKWYRNGMSDKALADEFGLSETAVRKIREDDYGPLIKPVDQRNADLASQIAVLEAQANELAIAISRLKSSILRQPYNEPPDTG